MLLTLQRLWKYSGKNRDDGKSQETWNLALSLCKTGSVTWDKDFNPLGFDFLAWQVGEQHLSANLSGAGRSNKSWEMCFEKQNALFRCKGSLGCTRRESFLSLWVLRSSINTEAPPPNPLMPTFSSSPGPSEKNGKTSAEAALRPACTLWISPSYFLLFIQLVLNPYVIK